MDKVKCDYCEKIFTPNKNYRYDHEVSGHKRTFCSIKCFGLSNVVQVQMPCHQCGKIKLKLPCEISKSKSGFMFCSRSCAASFNNTQKRKSRRSKVEKALFDLLVMEFPKLQFVHNDKTMLDGYEIDIAIPDLNIGIEWNGIVHFKPIYGQEKLSKVQQRDQEKQKIAEKKHISLIVIPDLVSNQARVKEAFAQVSKILRSQIKPMATGVEPA